MNDFFEDVEFVDVKIIIKIIFNNLEKFELDKKGFCVFVFDGVVVMIGVKLGVVIVLKKKNF